MSDGAARWRPPADGDWRADAKRKQHEALPAGPTVVSSTGPYGNGGLGQHLADLVEGLRQDGHLADYLTPAPKPQDPDALGIAVRPRAGKLLRARLVRASLSPGWRILTNNVAFDHAGARLLPADAEHLLVFNGHALRHLATARRLGYQSVGLVSANAHLAYEAREFARAYRRYPIERPWAARNVPRNLSEYAAADYIHVSSRYVWESFVREGVPEERLRLFPLTPNERFRPREHPPTATTFNVVYVGSLLVHKGTPLLIDAVRRLPHDDLRLVLVGGWGTRAMRRHIEAAKHADPRIVVAPGDPLPHLLQAGVAVHPSYGEGCAYAPGEAVACGVPLIASSNTGMNEAISGPVERHVVPTDDIDALALAIDAAYGGAWPPMPERPAAAQLTRPA
ncbi:MAG TPA: glycosyltransferase family 4 protein [Solirubrobacteraceae bacterium]|nr:glycosyltransferase family 4 protein [Solirubrobacteraceae bacterium]